MGLAGMGDLVATCTSEHSRNRTFGEALVKGKTLQSYQEETGMVVEGAQAVIGLYELGQQMDVEMPITSAVHAVLLRRRYARRPLLLALLTAFQMKNFME